MIEYMPKLIAISKERGWINWETKRKMVRKREPYERDKMIEMKGGGVNSNRQISKNLCWPKRRWELSISVGPTRLPVAASWGGRGTRVHPRSSVQLRMGCNLRGVLTCQVKKGKIGGSVVHTCPVRLVAVSLSLFHNQSYPFFFFQTSFSSLCFTLFII